MSETFENPHIKDFEAYSTKVLNDTELKKPEEMSDEQWEVEKSDKLDELVEEARKKLQEYGSIPLQMLPIEERFGLRSAFIKIQDETLGKLRKKFSKS